MALVQEKTRRSRLIAMKFNRFRKNKERREQSKWTPGMTTGGKNPVQGRTRPRGLCSQRSRSHARARGRGRHQGSPRLSPPRSAGQTRPLLWSSPCPVGTSDSNCTAPSRDGRNEGKLQEPGTGMLTPAPLCLHPPPAVQHPNRVTKACVQLKSACPPLETPPTPGSLLPNSHRQMHQ